MSGPFRSDFSPSFIYAQVQLLNGAFACSDLGSVPEIHYPVQFDTTIIDANGLWNPTLSGKALDVSYGVAAGGTGYTVNDILTVAGGSPTVAAQYKVATVNAGVVTGVTLQTAGSYNPRTTPTNPAATTGGTGTGCTLYVQYDGCYFLVPTGYNFAEAICNVAWSPNATGRRQVSVEKNYSAITPGPRNTISVNSVTNATVHGTSPFIFSVTGGDKITGTVMQNSGGNLNVTQGAATAFQIKLYKSLPSP